MKRMMVIATILLLALALLGATSVAAQTEYDSTINIRNMEDEDANVVIQFYDLAGVHRSDADVVLEVPAQSMAFYFVLLNEDLPVDFRGSAVVASDRELVIVHNLRINLGVQNASTRGFVAGSDVVRLPLLMRNNNNNTNWFSVQNAGTATAVVEVDFFAGSIAGNDWKWVNPADQTNQVSIEPGAAYYFDLAQMPALGDGFPGGRFIGAARVTSVNGQPLVASAVQPGPQGLFGWDGFATAGSPSIVAPIFQYWNAGNVTSMNIQNGGNEATEVTVTFRPGTHGTECQETRIIEPGAMEVFGLFAFNGPIAESNCWELNSANGVGETFIGSGLVTSNTTNQPLLGVVSQMNAVTTWSGSYNAFDMNAGSQCVAAPLVYDRNSGYWSSLHIANLGDSPVDVTISYSEDNGIQPPDDVFTNIPPGGMNFVMHWDHLGAGQRYIGSAVACGPDGASIVGVINLINTQIRGQDTMGVYEMFTVTD